MAGLPATKADEGVKLKHDLRAVHPTRQVLFHLGVFYTPPVNPATLLRQSFAQRMSDATPAPRPAFVAHLERLIGIHSRSSVTRTASRLNNFAAHLARLDPDLASLVGLERRRHIEIYLTARAEAVRPRTGAPLSALERRGRVLAVHWLINAIAEWGWGDAPRRRRCSVLICPNWRVRCPAI